MLVPMKHAGDWNFQTALLEKPLNLLINKKINYTSILFLFLFASLFSQQNDLEKFGKYGENILNSATQFDSQNAINYVIVAGSAVLAYQLDTTVNNFFKANKSPLLNSISVFNDYSIYALFATAGVLYLHGRIYDNNANRDLGLKLGSSLVYSTLITQVIKMAVGRERPTITDDNSNFHFFQSSWDYTSFPSGHSTAGFAFASVMALSTDNQFERAFYWSVAALMAVERLYNSHHWLSDVILGSCIGYFTGNLIASKNDELNRQPTTPIFNITVRF
jgi:membrane-associated phospholipid phosphatase